MIPVANSVAPLSASELARARQYLYGGLAWSVAGQLWMLAVLAGAYYGGATAAGQRWLRARVCPAWIETAGVAAELAVVVLALLLPFDYYAGFVRERAFGFEHMGAWAWLGQWVESSAVTVLAVVIVSGIAYAWLRRPRRPAWWLKLWIVVAVGVVLAVAVDPIWIAPLFNHFMPVRNPEVRADIEGLARRAGIPHAAIYQMDASRQSSHTNAYVVGVLGSQRIVVYDTLLRAETPAEIEFTVGHEIGHYALHHLWKGIAFTEVLLLGLFAVLGWLFPRWSRGRPAADVAALPLLLLILLGALYLAAPATNGFSRWEEHQADAYGLALSGQACAAVTGFEREERTDLIYPDPPDWIVIWFYDHPSQAARIAFAARQCKTPGTAH